MTNTTKEGVSELETRFRLLANSAPVMMWMSSIATGYIFFNDEWLRFTGRSIERELGQGWVELVHAEDLEQCVSAYAQALASQRSFSREYRLRRADGQYRWLFDQGAPRFEADGTFAGFIGSCVDITSEREARAQLRAILDSVAKPILLLDDHGRITLINPAGESLFGASEAALHGRFIGELLDLPWPLPEATTQEALRFDPHPDFQGKRGDGSVFPAEILLTRSAINGQNHYTLAVRDVTRVRQEEQELLDEMDDVQRRIGRDLHDGLGQLLTGVALLAKEIEYEAAPETAQKTTRLISLIERGIKMTKNLARGLAPIHLEATPLGDALRDLADQTAISHGVECVFESDGCEPQVGMRAQLFLIVQEAIANSLRHGGATRIEIHLDGFESGCALRVLDNGRGMSWPPATNGIGIRSMYQRARLIGGRLEFAQAATGGVEIRCIWKEAPRHAATNPDR